MSLTAIEATSTDHPAFGTLKSLIGTPARLSYQNPSNPSTVVRIPGTLRDVTATGVLVDLLFVLPVHNANQPVLIELMTGNSLYQACTFIVNTPSPLLALLHLPTDVHLTDRRRDPRFKVNIESTVQSAAGQHPVRIQNLSLGGCAISIGKQFTPHTHLTIDLAPLRVSPSLIDTEVVRTSLTPFGIWEIGLRFCDLSILQQEQLTTYFDQQALHQQALH